MGVLNLITGETVDAILDGHDCLEEQVKPYVNYLYSFGYLTAEEVNDANRIVAATNKFQTIAGLEPTGRIDSQVIGASRIPRCGIPDNMIMSEEARWRKNRLTYYVAGFVGGISQNDQTDLIAMAWRSWEQFADIKLTQVESSSGADIIISTGRGRQHGFDGSNGTLAWAYLPQGNDTQLLMRFDLDERWLTELGNPGILFLNVAAHEFGHLLGLDHSKKNSALMAPFYNPKIAVPQEQDDIPRIKSLYGAAKPSTPTEPTPPSDEVQRIIVEVRGNLTSARVVSLL